MSGSGADPLFPMAQCVPCQAEPAERRTVSGRGRGEDGRSRTRCGECAQCLLKISMLGWRFREQSVVFLRAITLLEGTRPCIF